MKQLFEINQNNQVDQLGSDKAKLEMSEDEIEELVFKNPSIIGENIFFIGRQVTTSTGKRLDLIAVDSNSNIIVIELKKGIAPREILAQVLDYTSWLHNLSEREIDNIIKSHFQKYGMPYKNIVEAFENIFKHPIINRIGNEIIPVMFADEFPEEIINAMNYLTDYGVPIRCIEFDFFKGVKNPYLYTCDILNHTPSDAINSHNNTNIHEEKPSIKKIVNNLTITLNSKYYDWLNSLKYAAPNHQFRTGQNRPGTWTISVIEWKFANNTLILEVPFWPKLEDKDPGFCIKFWFRRKMDNASISKIMKIKNELVAKDNFDDGGEENDFVLAKFYYNNMDQKYIEEVVCDTIDGLKSYVEDIMNLL